MSTLKKSVLGVLGNRMTASAQVVGVAIVAGDYRLIDIVSEGFVGAVWEPAAKVQIDVGRWDLRTYTPIDIDAAQGRASFLFYLHGQGAACRWAKTAQPGTQSRVTAPKPSLSLTDLKTAAVFFGDETSFAAAATLQRHAAGGFAVPCIFEASDADEAAKAIRHLGLADTNLVAKRDGSSHLADVAVMIRDFLSAAAARDLVLTGNGRSIQTLRAALKGQGGAASRQRVKAYWSPGKIGLD